MDARRTVGADGETAAARWLTRRGWTVLDRNVRYREGEIDLVTERDGIVAFVEVKARRGTRTGTGAESVTPAKQAKIRRCAIRYLNERAVHATAIRFDVVEIKVRGDTFAIRHLEGAF